MLNTEVYIRVRWGNKGQSISEASNKVAKLLLFLAQYDTVYENLFFVTGEEEKDYELTSLTSMGINQISNTIKERYLESNRRDIEKYNPEAIIDSTFKEPVGFLLSFYSSNDSSRSFNIRATIGKYGKADIPNQVLLTFPPKYLNEGTWFKRIFEYLIENFEPEKGGIYPNFTSKLKGNPREYPGWISYYSRGFHLPIIPSKVERQDFKKGFMFFVTQDDFDVQNREHIELWKEFYVKILENYPLETLP